MLAACGDERPQATAPVIRDITACSVDDLRIGSASQGAAGNLFGELTVRNVGRAACALTRTPSRIAIVDANGHRLLVRVLREPARPSPAKPLNRRPLVLTTSGKRATADSS
jgi:Protein of unknown function (DUF4232)